MVNNSTTVCALFCRTSNIFQLHSIFALEIRQFCTDSAAIRRWNLMAPKRLHLTNEIVFYCWLTSEIFKGLQHSSFFTMISLFLLTQFWDAILLVVCDPTSATMPLRPPNFCKIDRTIQSIGFRSVEQGGRLYYTCTISENATAKEKISQMQSLYKIAFWSQYG